jgi:hypothetical protein
MAGGKNLSSRSQSIKGLFPETFFIKSASARHFAKITSNSATSLVV